MTVKCSACDANLDGDSRDCVKCGASVTATRLDASKPVRKRLGLKFTILVIGTAGALLAGGGKPGRPTSAQAAPVTGVRLINIDRVGGSELRGIERHLSSAQHR